MKLHLATASLSLAFIGCSGLNQPISNEGNPLDSPLDAGKKESFSHNRSSTTNEYSSDRFPPGTTVKTSTSSAELYEKVPTFGLWSKKSAIPSGTTGRVINYNQEYAQVELEDGQIGYIKSQYLIESIVIEEPAPLEPPSDSIIIAEQEENTGAAFPISEEVENADIQVKQQTLSIPATGESENAYELSDEEIMKRIRKRKEELMTQREAAQPTTASAPKLPTTTKLPAPTTEEAVKEMIEVPAVDAPEVEIKVPTLE